MSILPFKHCLALASFAGWLVLGLGCATPSTTRTALASADAGAFRVARSTPVSVVLPREMVFAQYLSTFLQVYGSDAAFRDQFAALLEHPLATAAPASGCVLQVEEIRFGADTKLGLYLPTPVPFIALDTSKDFCVIQMQLRLVDGERVLAAGTLTVANASGHQLFSRKRRLRETVALAAKELKALVERGAAPSVQAGFVIICAGPANALRT